MKCSINISNINKTKLFTIETNTGFTSEATGLNSEILSISNAFTSIKPISAEKILKPSPTSVIYRINLVNGKILMLRGAPISGANLISAQCELIKLLPDNLFLEPIKTKESQWIFKSKNYAWMTYHFISGNIYDGKNCDLENVINAFINFESSLIKASEKLPDRFKKFIPTKRHHISNWESFYEKLLASPQIFLKEIGIELSDLSTNFLKKNRDFILELIKEVLPLIESSSPVLIHNDINHANIIIKKNNPIFLDLEDIIYEIPEISVTHGFFKILRHRIYQKQSIIEDACIEIDKYLPILINEGYKIFNKKTFFLYGASRILSDIYTICMMVFEENNSDLVYDLEKKIHNLIELHLIIWAKHGLKT